MKNSGKGQYIWFGFLIPIEEKLALLKECGFSSVMSWWGPEFDETDGDYLTHPILARKAGLETANAHIPYYEADLIWYDNLSGEALREKYIRDIVLAAERGVSTLVLHPFDFVAPVPSFGAVYENIMRIGDACIRYNVRIAAENLGDNKALAEVINTADNPNFGLCFDTGHNNLSAHNDFSLLEQFSDKLFALHIHDNNSSKDEHLVPFSGNIDWKSFISCIEKSSYSGDLTLESIYPFSEDLVKNGYYENPADMSAEEFLLMSSEMLDRITQLI